MQTIGYVCPQCGSAEPHRMAATSQTCWRTIAEARNCEHEPNSLGTSCQHCGIPAEMVPPDELAEHLSAAIATALREIAGQIGLFDGA